MLSKGGAKFQSLTPTNFQVRKGDPVPAQDSPYAVVNKTERGQGHPSFSPENIILC